jgi:hypothetical protein
MFCYVKLHLRYAPFISGSFNIAVITSRLHNVERQADQWKKIGKDLEGTDLGGSRGTMPAVHREHVNKTGVPTEMRNHTRPEHKFQVTTTPNCSP